MHDGIKLIAKPTQPTLCALLCAAHMKCLGVLATECHYLIEEADGRQVTLYARNDEACHRKMIQRWWSTYRKSDKSN